ncbi:Ig-like domain-containing protein [uncultured Clostridium sp.]|uniref:Ig-like domain-containing protein n=1 Tax=uncultured Clostridium sp. TaxID=59620 RepID=UPI0025DB39B5|nr:Ig-like domain-containing protein [uncultured Clostridium sp.]
MRFIKSMSLIILVIFSISNINYSNAVEMITNDEQYSNSTELLDNYQEENPTGDLAVEKEINVSDVSIVPEYEPFDNEVSTFSFSTINFSGRNTITTRDYARQQLGDGTTLQEAYDTVLAYLEDIHNDNVDFDSYYDGIKQDIKGNNVEVYLLKSLNMTSFGIDKTELKKIVDSVKYDHPEFFWLSSKFFYSGYLDNFTEQGLVWMPVVPKNYCTRKMRRDMREKIDEAMDEYRGLINDDMSDYEKEKIIHDKIIDETVYDPNLDRANESINDHNIAGVFIDHVAVCEGYARSMQILLNEVGIDNIYVVGKSHNEGHAWNQVKIDGSYYNLDSTWDDSYNKYRYFNVPDSIFDDHTAFTPSSSQYLYNIKSCNSNSAYSYLSSDDVDYFINIGNTDVGELTNDNMKLFLNAKLKDALNNNKFDIIFMCQDESMCQALYLYYKNNTNTSSNPQRTIFDSELSQKIVNLSGQFPNVSSYGKMLRFKFTPKSQYETKIQSITIPDEINLDSKDSYFINQLITPINANNKNLTWRSSNEGVVRIYNGILSPIASGDSLITCTSTDGSSVTSNTCRVHVNIVNKPVELIELPDEEITLSNIGETRKIQAIVNPSDASNGVLQWTSSSDYVYVSDNGTVTACTNRNVQSTITCKTTDGTNISKSCIVKINYDGTRDYIDTITMNQEQINLAVNSTKNLRDNIELNSNIDPNTAPLKWTSSDYNIAQIDEDTGEVKGITEGEATITCTANDRATGSNSEGWRRVSASCTVKVVRNEDNVLVNSITVSPESATLTALWETKTLTKTIEPDNATDTSVRWTSSDTGVATVTQSGVVKAMANGTAVITCKAQDGSEKIGQCTITVDIPESSGSTDVKVNSITVSPASVTLTSSGETKNLAVTIEPSNATDKSVNWTSSDTGVATVTQSGVVTAVSNGTAVITCEAQDGSGVKSTCNITVGISQSTNTIAKCNITGTERVGKILRVQVKDSDGKIVKKDLKYKWYRLDDKDSTTGKEVEDESSYKVKSSDKGEYIKVVVTDSSGNEVQDITDKIRKREVDDDDDDEDNNSSSSSTTNNSNNTNTNNVYSNTINTTSGYVQGQNQSGSWQQINGTWRFIQTGNQQISSQIITSGSYKWQQLNGKRYLSDSSNRKLTGWQNVDNS